MLAPSILFPTLRAQNVAGGSPQHKALPTWSDKPPKRPRIGRPLRFLDNADSREGPGACALRRNAG
jgi:hypothetical protein